MRFQSGIAVCLTSLVLAAAGSSASAAWSVVLLSPVNPDIYATQANGVDASHQVGSADFLDNGAPLFSHACLWSGSAASFVDLNPSTATSSYAYDADAGTQVGVAYFFGIGHAALWNGTAASFVDLNPDGAISAVATSVSGNKQGGYAVFATREHAGFWSSTPESFIDLHPASATSSRVLALDASHQVGYASFSGITYAALWSGSTASFVNLNPAGAISSAARAVDGSQQAGVVNLDNGVGQHAALWSGSAASFVDLHPAGFLFSEINAAASGTQVGNVYDLNTGYFRAGLWKGSATSFVNLHDLLPPGFSDSHALGVFVDNQSTYVVGYGYSLTLGWLGLLWKDSGLPTPTGACCIGQQCSIRTEAECLNLEGTYAGDGRPCPAFRADFDGNGFVQVADIFAFLNAWFSQFGSCIGDCTADFDGNSSVQVADIFAFLNAWFSEFGTTLPCP